MENGIEKINRILANLSSTQEDMLALKDYMRNLIGRVNK